MADKVAIDLLINAAGSAKTVGELKQSMKDLKNAAIEAGEGSKDFVRLTNAASQAKQQMDDLNDAVRALDTGEIGGTISKLGGGIAGGFQAATGAMALFGAESKEVEKTLLKVQAATALAQGLQSIQDLGKGFKAFGLILKANPIMLLGTVILGLVTAFVALKDKVKIFGDIFDGVANIVQRGVKWFKDLSDSILGTSFAIDDLNKKIGESRDKQIQSLQQLQKLREADYDRQIALIKAKGGETIMLERKKAEEILGIQRKMLSAYNSAIKVANEEEKQELINSRDELVQEILNRQNQLLITNINFIKEHQRQALGDIETLSNKAVTFNAKAMESVKMNTISAIDIVVQEMDYMTAEWVKNNARFIRVNEDTFNSTLQLFSALESLTEQGSASQKAFAISQAVINTYLGASKALATLPPPAGQIAAAATLIAGFANVRKIINTPTKSASVPSSGGGASSRNVTQGVNITPLRSTTSTVIDANAVEGGQSLIRAYVVENDITKTQKDIKAIERKSKI